MIEICENILMIGAVISLFFVGGMSCWGLYKLTRDL